MHADRRRNVFGTFFNLPLIFKVLRSKKLLVKYRMTFVNRYIIRISGVRQHEDEAAFTEADIDEKDSLKLKVSKTSNTSTSKKRKRKGRSGKDFAGKSKSAKSHKKRQKPKKRKATIS